ncbi:MAG: translation initiation factor IF-1 [Akkermansiaceae bacterium]|nr:translation initiation factor IF-1 [Akkermansiaceae bacterium]
MKAERLPAVPEPPIQTTGLIRAALRGSVFEVELPNGKLVVGHLPGRLAGLADSLSPGNRVALEMTPYDFEKARIAGPAERTDDHHE